MLGGNRPRGQNMQGLVFAEFTKVSPFAGPAEEAESLYGQCISRWVLRTVRKIVGHMTAPVRT